MEAIDVAAAAGMPLMIAGIVQDQAYFDELVRPRLDGECVSFVGAVGRSERSEFLGGADALLHLIGFDEPFGYSVVEAMACGTPVIAVARGSMRELIEEGVTGFLVTDVDGAVAAVGGLPRSTGLRIRATAVERFGVGRMVDEYIAAYDEIVGSAVGVPVDGRHLCDTENCAWLTLATPGSRATHRHHPATAAVRSQAMKGSQKPKKTGKKPAQKSLKERRSEKRAAAKTSRSLDV